MSGERSAAEVREAELARVFRWVGRAARRGDAVRYEELRAAHDRLKAEHVAASLSEHQAVVRARRAAEAAEAASAGPWRLPRGFQSPLAVQRARTGVRRREQPRGPEGGLSPWRRGGSPMRARIWWP